MESRAKEFFDNYQERVKVHFGHNLIAYKKNSYQRNNDFIAKCEQMIQFAGAMGYQMRAFAHVGNGSLSKAISDFSNAIREIPDVANLYECRGAVYGEMEDYNSAIEDLDTAIRMKDDSADSYYFRSLAYLGKGDFNHASNDCNKALNLKFTMESSKFDAYLIRGFLYGKSGDFGKAISDIETALQIRLGKVNDGRTDIDADFHVIAREYLEYTKQAQTEQKEAIAKKAEAKKLAEEKIKEEAEKKLAAKKANLRKAESNVFTAEFLQSFIKELTKFDKACKEIDAEERDNLLRIDVEQKNINEKAHILKEHGESINPSVSEKQSALARYEAGLQEISQAETDRHQALYAEIIKNKENEAETKRLRDELFANEGQTKQKRDELWNEYKRRCGMISSEREAQQEKDCKAANSKLAELNVADKKLKGRAQSLALQKTNAEIEKFTNKFSPEEISKEYAGIYADEPFEHFKNKAESPRSIRIASLTRDLSAENLCGSAKALLERHYPFLYRHKKLIAPYCLNIGETNGICFRQSKEKREDVYKTIQAYILKLLLQINSGLLKLTLYDGEGSAKNLIGLSHIDKRIKGENILTDQSELKRALETAVAGMNNTIQKVLGSKHANKSLMEYNKDAGERAEPYRIICITDFPIGLGKEHLELIAKIVRSGRQAGVFVIMYSDSKYAPKSSYDGMDINPLLGEMSVIEDDFYDRGLSLHLDNYFPDIDSLEQMQKRISAELSEELKKVRNKPTELSKDTLWLSDSNSSNGIKTPIGKMGFDDKYFEISVEDGSSNTPHHCLIGGAIGSGKTVLLHNIICNIAWNYSPDEVHFILLDYKEGTEFKFYENLPHAEVLSIHSEREYGVSVLEYINKELERRGEKFKEANAQNIAKYREKKPKEKMPRLVVIIDEFQKLLDGDMKTTTFVSKTLDDICRRGRSFGINFILSTQSLIGIDVNQVLSHFGLRIVLKLNTERDCDYFLEHGNYAPYRDLEKKGEAIYNASSGLARDNVRFQVAYLSDEDISKKISDLREKSKKEYSSDKPFFPRFKYDGNDSASIENNKAEYTPDDRKKCKIYIGEPVALEKEHSSYFLLPRNEYNVLMVGQDILAALSILKHSIQRIASNFAECQVYVCNTVQDEDHYDKLESLPSECENVKLLDNDAKIQQAIETVFEEVEKRKIESSKNRIILAFADIYNARNLRKNGYSDSCIE